MSGFWFVLLPATVFAVMPLVGRERGLRVALLRSVLVVSLLLALGTELLSLVHGVRPIVVVAFWLLSLAVALLLGLRLQDGERRLVLFLRWSRARVGAVVRLAWRTPSVLLMAAIILVVLGITVSLALAAPPNNWDSMTYHLPRVMHWASDHSVRDYPTTITRQLYSSPFAEYILLHVYLLTGSDLLFNSVQWAALAGSAIAVSVIARQLGGDRRAQLLAAVIAVTTPMAILQASTTQNDLVEAFFLLLTVHFALAIKPLAGERPRDVWMFGAALALCLFAKDTGYLLAGPFALLWLVRARRLPWRQLAACLGVIVALVAVVNVGLMVRNQKYFGSPLGSRTDTAALSNSHFGPAVTGAQMLRLAGSGSAWKDLSLNARVAADVAKYGTDLGVNPADPGLLAGGGYQIPFVVEEDFAGFPAQELAILFIALAAVLFIRPLRGLRGGYVLAAVGSFVVFASYLRWQPWINRLDMPLVLVWAPVIAVAVVYWHRWLAIPAALGFAFFTPAYLQHNTIRPLRGPTSVFTAPKDSMMFASHGDLAAPYAAAVKIINDSNARTVGLVMNADDWEYPLWRMTGGALNGRKFVDIQPVDLAGKPIPSYDVGLCTDLRPNACAVLNKPGYTVTPLGGGIEIAVKTAKTP